MKYALVCCYYGVLPNYFELWLDSAKKNTVIDFYIVTERNTIKEYETKINNTTNIKIVYCSFKELKKRIQTLFPFKISLNQPYKLCDYRLAYGLIFEDVFKGYNYFGWYDLDVIYGDLNNYLKTNENSEYDLIGINGHFTLIKNKDELKYLFYHSKSNDNRATPYKKVFTTNTSCFFDEFYGLHQLIKGREILDLRQSIADIGFLQHEFKSEMFKGTYILEKNMITNKLYVIDESSRKSEVLYVHLQKRKMIYDGISEFDKYYILPNRFVSSLKDNNALPIDVDIYATNRKMIKKTLFKAKTINITSNFLFFLRKFLKKGKIK